MNDSKPASRQPGYVNPKRLALRKMTQQERDQIVWDEEEEENGPVIVPNIHRDREALKKVNEIAAKREKWMKARLKELGI